MLQTCNRNICLDVYEKTVGIKIIVPLETIVSIPITVFIPVIKTIIPILYFCRIISQEKNISAHSRYNYYIYIHIFLSQTHFITVLGYR